MDKQKRKKDIAFMAIAAGMAAKAGEISGVLYVGEYLDLRTEGELRFHPGVRMVPEAFLNYFGDDTEFEYRTDKRGDVEMVAEINGVAFAASIRPYHGIPGGQSR